MLATHRNRLTPEMLAADLENCFVCVDLSALHLFTVHLAILPQKFHLAILTRNLTSEVWESSKASFRES